MPFLKIPFACLIRERISLFARYFGFIKRRSLKSNRSRNYLVYDNLKFPRARRLMLNVSSSVRRKFLGLFGSSFEPCLRGLYRCVISAGNKTMERRLKNSIAHRRSLPARIENPFAFSASRRCIENGELPCRVPPLRSCENLSIGNYFALRNSLDIGIFILLIL